ncbi:hypothetical protein GTU79_07065 [Sodalis ligni]|uniref:ankyrin repeat domain-containing protein n=1 Tax=Sodalis ligni TaxID=2697027 RepID=UPI001BDDE7D6|nr:hypothetical protein GTU79_07065 [Sodalis ligni]
MLAAIYQNFQIAELLLTRQDVDVNQVDFNTNSVLLHAVHGNQINLVQSLLKRAEIDFNYKIRMGPPLCLPQLRKNMVKLSNYYLTVS